ncbi:hypothetical protein BpHYR1_007941 [Brachionus plicatilis]|uniref:Uncharacterized protein n=1 Tax=Brachionus plicatilis TaxID=10195 RepID=A0A3M7PK06_BRAPC|nr:hypothetical protein BpHYR1_007941 [Brachionus plicatilis]
MSLRFTLLIVDGLLVIVDDDVIKFGLIMIEFQFTLMRKISFFQSNYLAYAVNGKIKLFQFE